MDYERIFAEYKDKIIGAKPSTKLLCLHDLVLELKKNNIVLDQNRIKEIVKSINPTGNEGFIKWIFEYFKQYNDLLTIPDLEEVSASKIEEEIEEQASFDPLPENLPNAEDTPYDIDFLDSLGISNPKRPWENNE